MMLNVSDSASVESVVKSINEQFGAPSVLINNAGITKDNIMLHERR